MSSAATIHDVQRLSHEGAENEAAAAAPAAQLPPKPTAEEFPNPYQLKRALRMWEIDLRFADLYSLKPPSALVNASRNPAKKRMAVKPPPSDRKLRKRPAKRLKKGKLCHIVVWYYIVVSC